MSSLLHRRVCESVCHIKQNVGLHFFFLLDRKITSLFIFTSSSASENEVQKDNKALAEKIIPLHVLQMIHPTMSSSPREWHHGSRHSSFIQGCLIIAVKETCLQRSISNVEPPFTTGYWKKKKDNFKPPFALANSIWHLSTHVVRKAQQVIRGMRHQSMAWSHTLRMARKTPS